MPRTGLNWYAWRHPPLTHPAHSTEREPSKMPLLRVQQRGGHLDVAQRRRAAGKPGGGRGQVRLLTIRMPRMPSHGFSCRWPCSAWNPNSCPELGFKCRGPIIWADYLCDLGKVNNLPDPQFLINNNNDNNFIEVISKLQENWHRLKEKICKWSRLFSRFSCIQVFAIPWTVARQAPLPMGFSKQEHWRGEPFPSPGDLPNPGIKPQFLAMQVDSLPSEWPLKPWQVIHPGYMENSKISTTKKQIIWFKNK